MRRACDVDQTNQAHDPQKTSWRQKLWDRIPRILLLTNPGRSPDTKDPVPLDKPCPQKVNESVPVWCKSYLRQSAVSGGGIGLVIQCGLEDKGQCSGSEGQRLIGGNTEPFVIEHGGHVQICLKTACLEADQGNGEGKDLCKDWLFRGQGTEWQFVLKLKTGFSLEGILGKVIMRTVRSLSHSETIGEFNLFFLPGAGPRGVPPAALSDDVWMSLGYRELAESLGILGEDSTIRDLCHELGFTDHESDRIQKSDDPFLSLLTRFRSRQGTPAEFIQKIYQCKRRSYIDPFSNDGEPQLLAQISDISSATAQVSGGLTAEQEVEDLTEAACLLQTPPRPTSKRHLAGVVGGIVPKRPCLRLDFTDRPREEENDEECDAKTLPAEDLEMYVFPPTPRKFEVPPTPPLTPLKRLTSLARDRKCPSNHGGNIFVFPDEAEGI